MPLTADEIAQAEKLFTRKQKYAKAHPYVSWALIAGGLFLYGLGMWGSLKAMEMARPHVSDPTTQPLPELALYTNNMLLLVACTMNVVSLVSFAGGAALVLRGIDVGFPRRREILMAKLGLAFLEDQRQKVARTPGTSEKL